MVVNTCDFSKTSNSVFHTANIFFTLSPSRADATQSHWLCALLRERETLERERKNTQYQHHFRCLWSALLLFNRTRCTWVVGFSFVCTFSERTYSWCEQKNFHRVFRHQSKSLHFNYSNDSSSCLFIDFAADWRLLGCFRVRSVYSI